MRCILVVASRSPAWIAGNGFVYLKERGASVAPSRRPLVPRLLVDHPVRPYATTMCSQHYLWWTKRNFMKTIRWHTAKATKQHFFSSILYNWPKAHTTNVGLRFCSGWQSRRGQRKKTWDEKCIWTIRPRFGWLNIAVVVVIGFFVSFFLLLFWHFIFGCFWSSRYRSFGTKIKLILIYCTATLWPRRWRIGVVALGRKSPDNLDGLVMLPVATDCTADFIYKNNKKRNNTRSINRRIVYAFYALANQLNRYIYIISNHTSIVSPATHIFYYVFFSVGNGQSSIMGRYVCRCRWLFEHTNPYKLPHQI